ncbi:class II aldolase/adducin family protein [Halomonas nitroreducens]|uniref:Class II aldolase/adducin family protein n=1 Tax=Halomonas nitroreducens TaxID=447425 RepID=A0A431V730_9GAMM|nr:class II aldolase/adducin family protein [Halomonas nitroreducens]RTR06501.1 class II aldolase/adducin family protein [Halomonas nitroreducens]
MRHPLNCSDAEWQQRVELAAAYQLCDHFGFSDLVWTHLSARVPGEPGRFLLNPEGLMFDEITASNLVKIDIEGHAVDGGRANPAAFTIHSAVYRARADHACAMHLHSRAANAVSTLAEGLLPVHQFCLEIGEVAYHDYEGFALDHAERERLAADLGDKHLMILRNHGMLGVGHDVASTFKRIYYLEKACETQLDALSMGRQLTLIPDDICRKARAQAAAWGDPGALEWQALLRLLARKGIDAHLR